MTRVSVKVITGCDTPPTKIVGVAQPVSAVRFIPIIWSCAGCTLVIKRMLVITGCVSAADTLATLTGVKARASAQSVAPTLRNPE